MAEKEAMRQMNIKISMEQDRLLGDLSIAYGNISKSNLIRIAIAEYIFNHRHLIETD